MSEKPGLRLVIAVHSEARPLLDHFRLRRATQEAFPVYDADGVSLIVSGVGKTAAAAATAYLEARRPHPLTVWLNIGIAGHRSHPIGTGFLAHRIRDSGSGRSYYPSLVATPAAPTSEVTTVDRPERGFAGDSLYEMEAAGFYETALRFATSELIQTFKIVSDTLENPAEELTKEKIGTLVSDQMGRLAELSNQMRELASVAVPQSHQSAHVAAFLETWHFSETQAFRLTHLLKRGELLLGEELRPSRFSECKESRQVLEALEEVLDRIVLGPT